MTQTVWSDSATPWAISSLSRVFASSCNLTTTTTTTGRNHHFALGREVNTIVGGGEVVSHEDPRFRKRGELRNWLSQFNGNRRAKNMEMVDCGLATS